MKTTCNETFKQLLTDYNLAHDCSFPVDLPVEVQMILSDTILITEYGVTLKSFNRLHKAVHDWENKSIIEDNENHFHVDHYIEPVDNKKAFMLGIKTLTLLAEKFQEEKIDGIRFWYAFQTAELGKLWARENKLADADEEHYSSDRLSFYKRRVGEEIISPELREGKFWAVMVIDI